MRDILNDVSNWVEKGEPFAIATVTQTWRSSPRPVGSSMVVSKAGEMLGSVSGGCVEKSIAVKAEEILAGEKAKVLKVGVSNEEAWEVGLSCGGQLEIYLEKFIAFGNEDDQVAWKTLRKAIDDNRSAVLISSLDDGSHWVYSGSEDVGPAILPLAESALEQRKNQVFETEDGRYFAQVFPVKDKMLLIGSAHITSELIILAKMHDFETIVIDPRNTFAEDTNYAEAPDQLLVKWPQEVLPHFDLDNTTYAVILSHDPRIDDAALEILLPSNVAYVGALGSKKTHEKRKNRLVNMGFSEEDLQKIHAPIGIDIGALLPREIALSVMAEVIAARNRATAK